MQTEQAVQPSARAGCGDARGLDAVSKVLLVTGVPEQRTAWSKARRDVSELLCGQGYQVVQVPQRASAREWVRLGTDLVARVGEGGQVLIEYPFAQRWRTGILRLLCRSRGARLHALIHDLDSLRFPDSPAWREITVLRLFDGLISHNPAMTQWLREAGLSRPVEDLHLFDYCADGQGPWHAHGMDAPLNVLFAGNLSHAKGRWLYDPRLAQMPGVRMSLFGEFFEPERIRGPAVRYKGVFDPQSPMLDGRYHFGLVWDGSSIDTCDGNYGHYMRFNNPHKLSLYLCLGLPVIVWREAAIAPFVQAQGIGVTVSSLHELAEVAARVDDVTYREMCRRAEALSERVRRGDFLVAALDRLAATA